VFPAPTVLEPGEFSAEIPPPDPPGPPSNLPMAPAPPPVDVIDKKLESVPLLPTPVLGESSSAPPPPTTTS
jgi:hypothetical protein